MSTLARDTSSPIGPFIDGDFTTSTGDSVTDIINPATEEIIARVSNATTHDVDRAVMSAWRAHKTGAWRSLRPADRERILLKFAELVETNGEELAQLETQNQGKSIGLARMVDVGGSVEWMRYAAGLATKIAGRSLDVSIPVPTGAKYTAYTRREPVGVVAAIAPWNFPMMIAVWKIMPALAAGCVVVLKPSEVTPLTAFRLAQLAMEAGVPRGVLNVISGDGDIAGSALIAHERVSKVTFTGSTRTGRFIAKSCAERLIPASLELGGKNPAIFFDDVDLEQAIPGAVMAGFMNSGQVCAAASRFYVHKSKYENFVQGLKQAIEALPIGPGHDEQNVITPVVSKLQLERVSGFVARAKASDAKIVTGGAMLDRPGFFFAPTLIVNAADDSEIQCEEVFGPVVTVTPFDSEEDVIGMANALNVGLTASIWTNDLKRAMSLIPKIETGTVWVNVHNPIDPNLPFGGVKQSGLGRDFGPSWAETYTYEKAVCIAH